MAKKVVRIGLWMPVAALAFTACMHYLEPERTVSGTDRFLYSYDENGDVLWKTPIESRAGGT